MSLFRKNDGKTEHLWVEERLSAYLDGELSSKERRAVDHHLARCKDCQWNLRTLRQTVRLTQELPTIPVPRVFTIPAPAQKPVRARQRRWGLGLLQGATALVALLLVFAVAGDFVLTGMVTGRSAAPIVMKEQAVVDSAATEAAEDEAPRAMRVYSESIAAPESGTVVEKSVTVSGAESTAEAEPPAASEPNAAAQATAGAEATPAPMLQTAPEESTGTAVPTPEPEASALGTAGFESPIEATGKAAGGGAATEAPAAAMQAPEQTPAAVGSAAAEPAVETEVAAVEVAADTTAATETTGGAEPAADAQTEAATEGVPEAGTRQAYSTAAPAPAAVLPSEPPAEQEPTIVAAAPALAPQVEQERAGEQEPAQVTAEYALATWVQRAEIALGVAFVLLAATTVAVMIRRRRAR